MFYLLVNLKFGAQLHSLWILFHTLRLDDIRFFNPSALNI